MYFQQHREYSLKQRYKFRCLQLICVLHFAWKKFILYSLMSRLIELIPSAMTVLTGKRNIQRNDGTVVFNVI